MRHLAALATTAVLAAGSLLPAAAIAQGAPQAGWPQARYDAAQTGYNPTEHILGVQNVSQLATAARIQLANEYSSAAPVVADKMVFTVSYSLTGPLGELEAFSQACAAVGKKPCAPLWTANVGPDASTSVAVADGEVIVDSDTGGQSPSQELWVFPEHCGTQGASCSALWTAVIPGGIGSEAPPTVAHGVVYVPGGDVDNAYLYAFPADCATPCQPTWRGQMDIGDFDESAAVGSGFVYIPDYDGYLDAFKVGCATRGRICSPTWRGYTGELGPPGATVAGGRVFVGSQDDDVEAFDATGCGTLDCSPVWEAVTGSNVLSEPAAAYGHIYITSDDGYLYSFPQRCSAVCTPTWKAFLSSGEDSSDSSPAVANGVVYVSWSNSVDRDGLMAFSAHCSTQGGTCTSLWTGNGGTHYLPSGPVVSAGKLWATGGPIDGPAVLYAFGLPPSSRAASGIGHS